MKLKLKIAPWKLVILAVICICAYALCNKYAGLNEYNEKIDYLSAQIQEQKEYSKELDKISRQYESDEHVEKYARSLGLVKPNEKIFRNYNDKK